MPDEDIAENQGIIMRVALLAVVIAILIFPWFFEIVGPDLSPAPETPLTNPLSSDSMRGKPTFIVAAHDSTAASKAQADYICDGIQDDEEINAAMNALSQEGKVILTEGTFRCDGAMYPGTGITLCGQGDTKTFLELTNYGSIRVDDEYVTLEQFHVSNCNRNINWAHYGVITIRAGHCRVRNVTGTSDASMQAVFFVFSSDLPDYTTGYDKIIEDIEFTNCSAIDCGGHGFMNNVYGENYTLIRNIRYTDCQAINCGRYEQFNPWITGFLITELNGVDNVRLTRCVAEGCWESGFHFDWNYANCTDVVLTDCIARNNGQKPYPVVDTQEFLSGFYVGKGEVTFVNCHTEGNSFAGFFAEDANEGVELYDCTDKNTAIGKSDFSIQKPASFYIVYSDNPVVMKDCSSTNSFGQGLYMGHVNACLENFVMTNASGVDGTAIQLGDDTQVWPWYFRGSAEIHASGNEAPILIRIACGKDADFTGSIVSDAAQPFVVDGSGTGNVVIHDIEILSNTLPAGSTGITITDNVPAGAVQVVNCRVFSQTPYSGVHLESMMPDGPIPQINDESVKWTIHGKTGCTQSSTRLTGHVRSQASNDV